MSSAESQQTARFHARTAFEALRESMTGAADLFAREAQVASALLSALDVEPSITKLTARFPINEERIRLATALDRYEVTRRSARVALWRGMLAEGARIGAIGRLCGLSGHVVSRHPPQEPQPGTDPAARMPES